MGGGVVRFWPALRKKPVALAANFAAGWIRRAATQKQYKQVVLWRFCFVVYKNISENIRKGSQRSAYLSHTLYVPYIRAVYERDALRYVHTSVSDIYGIFAVLLVAANVLCCAPLLFCPVYTFCGFPVFCSAPGAQVGVQKPWKKSKSQTRKLRWLPFASSLSVYSFVLK